MNKDIARLNIEHFRKLLEREAEEAKRGILFRLLAEEEVKLDALNRNPPEQKQAS